MADTTPTPGFFDGLGDRVVVRDRTAGSLEVLRLSPELTADPAFEPKVRARLQQIASLQHPGLARIRHVGRLASPDDRLAIVSDLADGLRLSEILQATEQMTLALHTNAALFLLRQLVSAVACLHDAGPDVSHGALAPERLVVSATGRLVVVEQVLGGALPHVPHPQPSRVWKDLRVALAAGEHPPFGRRTDVLQVGSCGLALVLGRPLRLEEYPLRLRELLDNATESTVTGGRRPLRPPLRAWLERTLEAGEPPETPWTIDEARRALDSLLASDGYLATPTGLATLLESVRRYFAGSDLDATKTSARTPPAPAETAIPESPQVTAPAQTVQPTPAAQAAPTAPAPEVQASRAEAPRIPTAHLTPAAPVSATAASPARETAASSAPATAVSPGSVMAASSASPAPSPVISASPTPGPSPVISVSPTPGPLATISASPTLASSPATSASPTPGASAIAASPPSAAPPSSLPESTSAIRPRPSADATPSIAPPQVSPGAPAASPRATLGSLLPEATPPAATAHVTQRDDPAARQHETTPTPAPARDTTQVPPWAAPKTLAAPQPEASVSPERDAPRVPRDQADALSHESRRPPVPPPDVAANRGTVTARSEEGGAAVSKPEPTMTTASATRLRLVSPTVSSAPAFSARTSMPVPRDLGTTRTQGSLAVAPAADVHDDSFAPEAGVSFPPDEPEPEPTVAPPAPPPPPRPASGAIPIAASPGAAPGSGAELVAEPIAASLARDSLADLVHTRPGSTTRRVSSGPSRTSRSMFDVGADRPVPSHAGGLSLPLKVAAAAGVLMLLGVAGWFVIGGRSAPEKPAPTPARRAATAPAPRPAAPARPAPAEEAPARTPGGSETLPPSLAGAAAAAQEAGSVQIETPFPLEVFEDAVRVGASDAPIVLSAGRHQLDLVNRDYSFRGRQVVDVRPGRATRVAAKLPTGVAHVNAAPWAEVWIDGARAGETPLGNLSLTIGPHEVVFRHPQLGEQTRTLVVTAGTATRLSVEMQQ